MVIVLAHMPVLGGVLVVIVLAHMLDKDGHMSEDDHHKNSAKVQELTDRLIKDVDQTLATKELEIKQV